MWRKAEAEVGEIRPSTEMTIPNSTIPKAL